MKKQLLLLLVLGASVITVQAQHKSAVSSDMKLNIAVEGAIPVGDASDVYSFGLGVSGKIEAPVASSLNFTGNIGLTNFMIKDNVKQFLRLAGDNSSSRWFIPLEAGLRYYINPNFYGEGQIGASISTKDGVGTAFAYTPGIGVIFPTSGGDAFDAGFRYEAWSKDGTLGFIGLHVAYKFGL